MVPGYSVLVLLLHDRLSQSWNHCRLTHNLCIIKSEHSQHTHASMDRKWLAIFNIMYYRDRLWALKEANSRKNVKEETLASDTLEIKTFFVLCSAAWCLLFVFLIKFNNCDEYSLSISFLMELFEDRSTLLLSWLLWPQINLAICSLDSFKGADPGLWSLTRLADSVSGYCWKSTSWMHSC